MSILSTASPRVQSGDPSCPECAGHGFTADPFGSPDLVRCPVCLDQPPAPLPDPLEALAFQLEEAERAAEYRAENHGATHERDIQAGVARGLRLALEMVREMMTPRVADLAQRDEELAEAS